MTYLSDLSLGYGSTSTKLGNCFVKVAHCGAQLAQKEMRIAPLVFVSWRVSSYDARADLHVVMSLWDSVARNGLWWLEANEAWRCKDALGMCRSLEKI